MENNMFDGVVNKLFKFEHRDKAVNQQIKELTDLADYATLVIKKEGRVQKVMIKRGVTLNIAKALGAIK